MLKNVYILYIDTPNSKQYLEDCLDSCSKFPGINPIPVLGYTGLNYDKLCEMYNLRKIPWRLDKNLEDFPGCFDLSASVEASHYMIWKMIIESGEPGVILEHKSLIKGPIDDIQINDYEVLHLGPRILYQDDYTYPKGVKKTRIKVDQWEGVHAYAITPKTAEYLFEYLDENGCVDCIDAMLAFRNMVDLNMYTIDPPPIVVSNGGRNSTYTPTGVSAFWNSFHSPQYLANVKPGAQIAPIRKITVTDRSFSDSKDWVLETLSNLGIQAKQENDILVINGNEGYEALKLGNHLLNHDDSRMHVLASNRQAKLCGFNLYFCWNYTKINTIPVDNYLDLLYNSTNDDVHFNVIFMNVSKFSPDTISNYVLSWNLLSPGGVLIVKNPIELDKFISCLDKNHIVCIKDDLVIIKK